MSVDKKIDELIAALDRNTAALTAAGTSAGSTSTAAATTGKAKKEEKKEEPKITQEQVNAALIKIKDDFSMDEAKAIIKSAGKVDKMADIKPANYQAVYDAAVARHAELTEAGSGGNDDGGI